MHKLKYLVTAAAFATTVAYAAPVEHRQAEKQTLAWAEQAIALRSVAGAGNQTPAVASLFRAALIDSGFQAHNVTITTFGDTAYLIARWPGSDPSLKPLVISGHMDVVEAKPADWQRDPFKPVVENGYLYGRGSTDMKLDDSMAIAALGELKRNGFKPRRDIVVEFSGDEETAMATGAIIADKLANAELVLNVDGANGALDEQTGSPSYFTWEAAEKTYADFQMTVTNPGGHSSEPRAVNAIDELAEGLLRIQHYQFKPETNALTQSYFVNAARWAPAKTAAAMRAFAADPSDKAAIATLSADPALIGKIGTTCVATMIDGGHALNALPQRATANINCRIFPGHPRLSIMAELEKVAADPEITFKDVSSGSVATEPSPMRHDLVDAMETAVHSVYPGLPVFPSLSSGASDSMWFRKDHVDSYGVSPIFIKPSEDFAHGLNERTPTETIRPSLDILLSLIPALAK